jgi:hypothetical protein
MFEIQKNDFAVRTFLLLLVPTGFAVHSAYKELAALQQQEKEDQDLWD